MTEFPIKHSDNKTADSKTAKAKLLSKTECIFEEIWQCIQILLHCSFEYTLNIDFVDLSFEEKASLMQQQLDGI